MYVEEDGDRSIYKVTCDCCGSKLSIKLYDIKMVNSIIYTDCINCEETVIIGDLNDNNLSLHDTWKKAIRNNMKKFVDEFSDASLKNY
jgi:hypothetical protein